MFRFVVVLATLFCASAFAPLAFRNRGQSALQMKFDAPSSISKALGIAAMGFALTGTPVLADGAKSASTIYRARTNYGYKIFNLAEAASKGDFASFEARANSFDLFISQANPTGIKGQEIAAKETKIKNDIFAAVAARDSGKLKAAYDEFIKVADLKPDYKNNEKGQTDSSGYSPTWGTEKQYIYQR